MTRARLEHANLTVSDPERSAQMVEMLFGWEERWRGPARDNGFTIHVGTEADYIAFYTGPGGIDLSAHYPKGKPLNHIGVLVDNLDEVEKRVVALGLTPFSHGDYAPGRRFYFLDPDGIEFEVVSYA
jgi:catechol 2,3-dioxygenase-like lactoylglutathione lyase family enzyme